LINEKTSKRIRPEIRSLCIDDNTWKQAQELALREERSISSLIRLVIKKMYLSCQSELDNSRKIVTSSLAVKKASKTLIS